MRCYQQAGGDRPRQLEELKWSAARRYLAGNWAEG